MIHRANILIIGAGILGCSVAYHLARKGQKDIVVLEKSGITHGATWHAAGLVGQLRSSRNTTRMLQKSVAMYEELQQEAGVEIDWMQTGSLRLACTSDRMLELKKLATMARSFDLQMDLLTPAEARDLFPLMTVDDVIGAAFLPTDGQVDPSSLCQAIASAARKLGVRFEIGQQVKGLEQTNSGVWRITAVKTESDEWRCDTLVNCAGMWARELGELSGVHIPACALEHQYLVTETIADLPSGLPSLRDPDNRIYYKVDAGCIAVGGYEDDTLPFAANGIPTDFGQELLPSNFDRFEGLATAAANRTPVINKVGIRQLINGPIPYSADGDFVMGKAPNLDNYFVASGFLYGIAGGGGAGEMMAEWILDGEPGLDLWPLDIRRFFPHHNTPYFMYQRAVEHYGGHYRQQFPAQEAISARGIRRSPLYETLAKQDAVFGSKAGWERVNWFALEGKTENRLSFDRRRCSYFSSVAREHQHIRENAALIDQSSFAKLEIFGKRALDYLQYLAVSDLDTEIGKVSYTQLCNHRGGIEADVTVSRLADDRFYLVTGSGFAVHDWHWIKSHLRSGDYQGDTDVQFFDVTSAHAVINICGPRCRDILQAVTLQDVSSGVFPFATCRNINIGAAQVLAIRIGYVGELGWELHIPTEFAAHVYELLMQAGIPRGLINAGYYCIDTLRMEKAYLYWSTDITPDYTPFEAGIGFTVSFDKATNFIGRKALEQQRANGVDRRLCTFTVDPDVSLYGGETVLFDGQVIGITTSGNTGFTVNQAIAFAYVPAQLVKEEAFEIEAFSCRFPAKREQRVLYDPSMEKLRS